MTKEEIVRYTDPKNFEACASALKEIREGLELIRDNGGGESKLINKHIDALQFAETVVSHLILGFEREKNRFFES